VVTFFRKYEYAPPREVILAHTVDGQLMHLNTLLASLYRLKKRVYSWAKMIEELRNLNPVAYRVAMITLTYRGEGKWKPNHVRDYLKQLKRLLGSRWIAVSWVCEMQKRGEPHYHILIVVKKGTLIPKPDGSGMWPHGWSRVETARSGAGYLAKYAQKVEQKGANYPKGARKFAVTVNRQYFASSAIWKFRLSALPGWLRIEMERLSSIVSRPFPKRMKGGGWIDPQTGEKFYSPWELWELGGPDWDALYGYDPDIHREIAAEEEREREREEREKQVAANRIKHPPLPPAVFAQTA